MLITNSSLVRQYRTTNIRMMTKLAIFSVALILVTLLDNVSASSRKDQKSEEAIVVEHYYENAFHFLSVEEFYRFYEKFQIAKTQNNTLKRNFDDKMQKCFDGVHFDQLHSIIVKGTDSICSLEHISRLTNYHNELYIFEMGLGKHLHKCRLTPFFKVYVLQILSQCLSHLKNHLHHGETAVCKVDRHNLYQYLRELHINGVHGKLEKVEAISITYGQFGLDTRLIDLIRLGLTTSYKQTMIDVSKSYYDITQKPRDICSASYPYYSAVLAIASLSQLIYGGGSIQLPHLGYKEVSNAAEGPTVERWIVISVVCQVFRKLRPIGSTELAPLDTPNQLTVKLDTIDKRIAQFVYEKKKPTISDRIHKVFNKL